MKRVDIMNRGDKAAQRLLDFLNSATIMDRDDFVQSLTNDHRFLQQEAFKLFLSCIEEWALDYESGNYDDRNMYTSKSSSQIVKALRENDLF